MQHVPVLPSADRFLQDALGSEVKGCARAPCRINPINRPLPMVILIVVQHTIRVFARVPELPERHFWDASIDIQLSVFASIALDEIEAPTVKTHRTAEVVEPLDEIFSYLLIRVVQVRGCSVVLSCGWEGWGGHVTLGGASRAIHALWKRPAVDMPHPKICVRWDGPALYILNLTAHLHWYDPSCAVSHDLCA